MSRSRMWRLALLVCTGAVMTQFVGCSTILAPTILGLVENILLSTLFGGLFGGGGIPLG